MNNTLRKTFLGALVVALPFVEAAAQQPTLTPYDVFVYRNFNLVNTEVNGRVAIGGDARLSHFGVGHFLPNGFPDYSLVVGGNVTADSGSVAQGRTFIGGTNNSLDVGYNSAPETGVSPINFAAESARLTGISAGYASLTTNSTTQLYGDILQFLGNSDRNVFSVSIAQLQAGTGGYEFFTPEGTTNIVNVTGTSATSVFNNAGYFFDCTNAPDTTTCRTGTNNFTPLDVAHTIFNFATQTSLTIDSPVHGSILAPNADVTFGRGDVVGTVVVGSAIAGAEFYDNRDFVEATPEPATLVLVGSALLGVMGFARRRKA